MHNSSTHNTNRKTISTNLKNGAPITLREYDRFTVRGEVAYSHFKSPLSPKQIENKNKRRDEWAKSEGNVGPYYHDDPSVPYGELVIKNADIVSRYPGQTTNAELFAMDHLFESTNHDYGIKKMNMKNHVATVSTGLYSSEGVTLCQNANVDLTVLKPFVGHSASMDTYGTYARTTDALRKRAAHDVDDAFKQLLSS